MSVQTDAKYSLANILGSPLVARGRSLHKLCTGCQKGPCISDTPINYICVLCKHKFSSQLASAGPMHSYPHRCPGCSVKRNVCQACDHSLLTPASATTQRKDMCQECESTVTRSTETNTHSCDICKQSFQTDIASTGSDHSQLPLRCHFCANTHNLCTCCTKAINPPTNTADFF